MKTNLSEPGLRVSRSVSQSMLPNVSSGAGWASRMGWRTIAFIELDRMLAFRIEPMCGGEDLVFVPEPKAWNTRAPSWAKGRREEFLERLRSVEWNRELLWIEGPQHLIYSMDKAFPNSVEGSLEGHILEDQRLFHPDSGYTHDLAHVIWEAQVEAFAASARGRIQVHLSGLIANSVFEAIELPALMANPKISLDYM